MICMTEQRIPNGTPVNVTHDLGTETGTVIGTTHGTDHVRYDVRFADGTISSWGAHRVVPA